MDGDTAQLTVDVAVPGADDGPDWIDTWLDRLADRLAHRLGARPAAGGTAGTRGPDALRARWRAQLTGRTAVAVRDPGTGATAFAGVRPARHPLTGATVTRLSHLDATSPTALAGLLEVLRERGELDAVAAEVTAGEELLAGGLSAIGLEPVIVTFRFPLRGAAPHAATGPAAGLEVAPVTADQVPFVRECVEIAVRRGLRGGTPTVDVAAWVRDRFPLTGGALCLVGTLDGRPVCHALGYERPDPYGAARVLHLVDVFVVEGHKGMGLSHRMSAEVMRRAAGAGFDLVESEVVRSPGAAALTAGLTRAGWVEDRAIWTNP